MLQMCIVQFVGKMVYSLLYSRQIGDILFSDKFILFRIIRNKGFLYLCNYYGSTGRKKIEH